MKELGRKFWMFILSLAVITLLSFFGKDTTAVITLYGVFCTGNVAAKVAVNTSRKEL